MREVTEDLFNKCPHLEEDCQCYISSFLLYMLDIPFSFLLYYLHALFHRHMLYLFISFLLQHVVDFFISYMWLTGLLHMLNVMIFPFLFFLLYFLLLIPLYSIRTAFPFHSHITSPRGSPCFPYLWLTSLEAYFSFYSRTALWLVLTPFHLEAAPPLYFPSVWLVMTRPLSFTGLPFALLSMYKYLVG